MSDRDWRLNNLYFVMDEAGKKVQFKPNWAQRQLLKGMWFLNLILKSRQLGFSTFVMIYMLDTALFNSNIRCGVIAHNRDDAEYLFRDKIKFAYDNLPDWLKEARPATTDSKSEILFDNNSSIRVSTSFRGGTIQMLHVSEFGKICRKYPDKAKEIVSGAFNAVHAGQMIFVESTAEGRDGDFYRMCMDAQKAQQLEHQLTELDFRFWFFPWWRDPRYRMDPANVIIFPQLRAYFEELEKSEGIRLTASQKAWYAKKAATMGELMWREYPSTVKEAFDARIKGAYFADQLAAARKEKRITRVPYHPGTLVDTWWDLGMNDETAIWFTQNVGREIRVIDYYENSGEGLKHYAQVLQDRSEEKGYSYGRHVAPHDIDVREIGGGEEGEGRSRLKTAAALGIRFEVCPKLPKVDQIEAARNIIPQCVFDEEACDQGLAHLDNYRKEWDEKRGVWRDKPYHGPESNGADSFQILAVAHNFESTQRAMARRVQKQSAAGWT